jgi:hypothetical protein
MTEGRWAYQGGSVILELFSSMSGKTLLFSGAWEKMIHEKNLKQKISCHCPFKSGLKGAGIRL